MEHNSVGCQVCFIQFKSIFKLKQHFCSRAHEEKMEKVFQKDNFKGHGKFPFITPLGKHEKHPIIGLSLLTLCFSRHTDTHYYLCHVCEEQRPSDKILHHLSSRDHCSNYFNYTNPNVLPFSWLPGMDMRAFLKPEITKEVNERGPGLLQMLDLPGYLFEKLETSTYNEAMQILSENEKLPKLFEAVKPNRTMLQTYQRDSNRKHPLLGMQHLVECICVGQTEKRHYLCTLCNLTIATHTIIKHVLSFDHIFCYFRAWHPSTLLTKECYQNYSEDFACMILDLAKQTEEIHGTANTDMKQVTLEPGTSVNFSRYAEALKKLESITKENKTSLITTVKPGNKLALKKLESITKENKKSSLNTTVKPGNKLERHTASAGSVAVHATLFYKVRCQNCSMVFTISQYLNHLADLKNWTHKRMLKKSFAEAGRDDQKAFTPRLDLYTYARGKEPAVGASLIVTCITTEIQMKPIYVCFACEDAFSDSLLKEHVDSVKHLILTLVYLNPWRLPFAWEKPLDVNLLMSMAWEEEKERGSHQMMLKVLDMPYWMFQRLLPPSYTKVMERLELYHVLLKREVPRCETYSKLQQNERFPMLGHQFMVSYSAAVKWHPSTERQSLCLLCERKLSKEECYAHVFSREHVGSFLNRFHPGSLDSGMDAETLLDLAKQAARIHSVSHSQVMSCETPIWEPCSYRKTISILASVKRREGKGKLEPEIIPKMKLSPRKTSKDVDKDCVRDNSQTNGRMMEEPEKNSSEKSIDNNETTLKKISVEAGADITSAADKKTRTQSEKESQQRREVFSKACLEETMNAGSMCLAIKVEKIEEEINEETVEKKIKQEKVEEPTATIDSCQNTDKNDETELGEKWSKSSKEVSTPLNNIYKENERKRPSSMFEKSQDTLDHKRQRLTSKQDSSKGSGGKPSHETAKDEVSSNVNRQQGAHLWQYLQRESREPVVGLSALIECHCDQRAPIYLCECCSLKILEKDIVSHVIGLYHQKVYLGLQELSWNEQKKRIRHEAALVEKEKGYGDAQVIDLDEEIYNNISKQNFKSAIQTVKTLHAQQGSGRELPSTTALPAVHPVDTSVTLHTQHEVYSPMDDFRVVKMEIDDDSEDSEAQLSSIAAAVSVISGTTSKTTEGVNMTNIKVLDSADKANTCLTVQSRSSKETASLHVSVGGANTTCIHPESTGKAEHISNTSVGSLKIATTSKIVGTCQTSATSNSMETNHTRPMTAKTSSSIPDTRSSTISKLPANSSRYTTCTTLKETACRNVANNSSAGATPSKSTANASKLTGTTTTSSATTSSTTSTTKPATPFKPLESRTAATSMQVAVSSAKAATISNTGSKVVCEATSKTVPASKNSETASKAMMTSAASANMTNMSIKDQNTKASVKTVHMKNSLGSSADVAPKIPKSDTPAALRQTMLMSVRSENKSPPTEPSHASASKTKPPETAPRVGLNQLIVVSCEGKRQVYCQLCSVKLNSSRHPLRFEHKYNYVKMLYPWWTAKPSEVESKLDNMVANLAHVEKNVGPCSNQTMEVSIDEYNELNGLPDDKALERVKAMVKQSESRVSSSTTDATEVLRQQVAFASPCEISSPDDGTSMPQNEMAGPSADNQSEHENKHELQMLEEDVNFAMGQSHRAQSLKGKSAETNELILGQLHLGPTLSNDPKPITTPTTPSMQDVDIEDKFEGVKNVESQAMGVSVTTAIESSVKMGKPQCCASPLAADSESARRFAQTPGTCQETLLRGKQQERSDPDLQDGQKVLEGTQKTSPVKLFNTDLLPSSASVNTEQQQQSRPNQKAEHVTKHHSASQALSRMSIGEKTQDSHLSTYLKVRGLENEPVIGLGSIWECRGITQKTFFLCESCKVMLSVGLICDHIISIEHKFKYALKQDPKLMSLWQDDERQEEILLEHLLKIVDELLYRERLEKTKAQCVMLGNELYEYLQKASFSEALRIVKDIWKEQRLSVLCLPPSQQKDQQPEGRQSQEESLSTVMLSAQALETERRSDNEARQKTEPRLEDTAMVGDLEEVKQGRVLSLDVTSVSLQTDSVVSPLSAAATHITPKETCGSLFVQPVVKPPVSQQQRPVSELQVKRAEVCSESPCSSVVSPSQSPSPSPSDKCLSTRKRPADETLVRPNINNQLEGPFAAKCSCSALQPASQPSPDSASESTSVNHAATSTLLSPKNEGTGPGSDEQDTPILDWDSFAQIMAMVRERKSEINMLPCPSAPVNAETTTSSTNTTESAVGRRWETKCVQTTSTVAKIEWDSEPQLVKATSNADSAGTTVSTGVCQLPINTIVTARPDPTKQQFVGGFNGQDHTEVKRGDQVSYCFSTAAAANASDTVAAPGGYGQYGHTAYFANGHSDYLSSAAVAGYITPNNPPGYTGSLHQQEGYTTGGLYPGQIYPGQEANHFGHTLTTPTTPGWVRLGMQQLNQQQQIMQQQQQQPPQQLTQQQQYLSWTSGSLATGNGNMTSECAFFGTVQFPTSANNSQMLMGLNNYSTNTIVPTQNGNIIITQHNPQVYLNPDSRFSYNQQ